MFAVGKLGIGEKKEKMSNKLGTQKWDSQLSLKAVLSPWLPDDETDYKNDDTTAMSDGGLLDRENGNKKR